MDLNVTDYEVIVLAVGVVGVYLKLHNDIMNLKAQYHGLDSNNQKIDKKLEQVVDDLAQIKLMLARNQMDQ